MMRMAIVFALLVVCGASGLGLLERQLVYPFDPTHVSPETVGLTNVREHEFRVGPETLILWVANAKHQKPTILYFHGNAGNLANRAGRFRRFMDRGYGLIAVAYRGSSGSTGSPDETAITLDAQRIYKDMDKIISGLSPTGVIIYGESLGTGVALKLIATTRDMDQPAGVILEAPYTSLPDVVLFNAPQLGPLLERMANVWDSAEHAKSLRAPLLVMHGVRDKLIPIEQGRRVFDAAASRHKTFVKVRGAGHETVWRSTTLPKMWKFIDAQSLSIR